MKRDPKILDRLVKTIFGMPKKQKDRSKKRSLGLESLENRELLAVVGFHSVQDAEEGGQAGYFRLERNDTQGDLTVYYQLDYRNSACCSYSTEGWAKSGEDFSFLPGTGTYCDYGYATFTAGQQYANIVVNAVDDTKVEGPEQLRLTLTTNSGCGCGCCCGDDPIPYAIDSTKSTATLTIVDDDAAQTVWIDSIQNGEEGGDNGYFRLKRDNTSGSLTVWYDLYSNNSGCSYSNYTGWAKNGTDFSWLPGTDSYNNRGYVTFAAGQAYVDVAINVIDDNIVEGDECFFLNVSGTVVPVVDGPVVASIELLNDTGDPDGMTICPLLRGDISGNFAGGAVLVQFDHDGDGVVDGAVRVNEYSSSFEYDPLWFGDFSATGASVDLDLKYRIVHLDGAGQEFSISEWNSFEYILENVRTSSFAVSEFGLVKTTPGIWTGDDRIELSGRVSGVASNRFVQIMIEGRRTESVKVTKKRRRANNVVTKKKFSTPELRLKKAKTRISRDTSFQLRILNFQLRIFFEQLFVSRFPLIFHAAKNTK